MRSGDCGCTAAGVSERRGARGTSTTFGATSRSSPNERAPPALVLGHFSRWPALVDVGVEPAYPLGRMNSFAVLALAIGLAGCNGSLPSAGPHQEDAGDPLADAEPPLNAPAWLEGARVMVRGQGVDINE